MEEKKNTTHNNFLNFSSNKEKYTKSDKNIKKLEINTYVHNSKNNTISKKNYEQNNLSTLNDSKKHQKIKKYLFSSYKNIEKINKKSNNLSVNKKEEPLFENENVTEFNATEIKKNKHQIKNIRVNKLKIEDIYKDNDINVNANVNLNSNTIRGDFFHKQQDNNKSFHNNDETNNNMNIFCFLSNHKKNQRKSNIISVKSFNKNKDSNQLINSEYINFNNNNNYSFYENNALNNNLSSYKKNRIIGTYSNSNSTTAGKTKISTTNSSKFFINFKNLKTFYAHLEILISLYLKRNFKYFIEKIKEYENNRIYCNTINNKNGPIINVNNAHCSLYCSININQDNENNNKLFKTVFSPNNTISPLTKRNEKENDNMNLLNKKFNNIKRNRLIFINPEPEMNLSTNNKLDKGINKSVYVPKNKITKFNNDSNNNVIKNKNDNNISNNNIINNYNNIGQNIKRSSPIKEMNINLKKINVCRLNDLNQLYCNQKLLKTKSNNISFSDMNNIISINNSNSNNNIGHTKYYSNAIQINNNNSNNISIDKNKLKKISSAKNGVYIKPKEKMIKEIKIQNNQNKMTPYKSELCDTKTKHMKSENIVTISNNFYKNKNHFNYLSKWKQIDSYSINTSIINNSHDKNVIKKIYIRRNSKKLNKNSSGDSKMDYNGNKCLSTLLSFKNIKENNNNNKKNEILIKQITTSDKRIFININYVLLSNYIKVNNKYNIVSYNILSLQDSPQCSISIINNELILTEYDSKLNEKINESDIFRFDNDKKKKDKNIKNIKSKNKSKDITFLYNEKIVSKDEKKKLIKLKKIIKGFINKKYIKVIFNIYKKHKCLRKILLNKKRRILYYYLSKLNKKIKYNSNSDKNNGVYHKINYNDDFNLTKRMKTPNNSKQIHCKTKVYNLTSQNSINQNKIKSKIKKLRESSSINFNSTQKYKNKEINIFVHK